MYNIDELDPDHLDRVIRTVYGESSNQPLTGQQAVAAVIANRAQQSGMSLRDVVMAPSQFEPWGNSAARKRMEALDPNSETYQNIRNNVVLPVLSGQLQDPTGGATHFYAPRAQAALGRNKPSWDDGSGTMVGDHMFFNLGYNGTGRHGIGRAGLANRDAPNRPAPGAIETQASIGPNSPVPVLPEDAPRIQSVTQESLPNTSTPQNPNTPAQPRPPGQSNTPPSIWDNLKNGGPLALVGAPQPGFSWKEALQGIAVAGMSGSNPQGAAALANHYKNIKDAETRLALRKPGGPTSSEDHSTGFTTYDDGKGNKRTVPIENWKDKTKAFGPQMFKMVDKLHEKIDNAGSSVADLNEFRELIADNKMDLDYFSRISSSADAIRNASDERQRNAARFHQKILEIRDKKLMEAAGVQTDPDAVRALESLIPGSSKYDASRTFAHLTDLSKGFRGSFERNRSMARELYEAHPNADGTRLKPYEDTIKRIEEFETRFAPKAEKFLRDWDARVRPQTTEQPTPRAGQQPAPTTTPQTTIPAGRYVWDPTTRKMVPAQ